MIKEFGEEKEVVKSNLYIQSMEAPQQVKKVKPNLKHLTAD